MSGCCNGGPVMLATTDPTTAKQLVADATISANVEIDTLTSAFGDAQFAVVMLGTNDPTNPNNLSDLTAIVDRLEAQRVVPVLTTIPPRNDGVSNSFTVQFNAAVTAGRNAGLPLIDFLSRRFSCASRATVVRHAHRPTASTDVERRWIHDAQQPVCARRRCRPPRQQGTPRRTSGTCCAAG